MLGSSAGLLAEQRPDRHAGDHAGEPEPRWLRAALTALVAYALLVVAAQAVVRVLAWDMRGFDANLIDYTWQIELPWRATRGEWSGRDFHFPMGPLWQVFALAGTLGGGFSAPLVIAGMQVATQLGGIGIALWLGAKARGVSRLLLVGAVMLASYGAGISTLRPLLSVVHLWLYARDARDDQPARWSSAAAAAGVATLLMLFSFDRLVFASLAVVAMSSFEYLARRRSGLPARISLIRFLRYALAQAACLAAAALFAVALGANPIEYVAGQRRLTASYAVNMATSAEGSPVAGATLFALSAVGLVLWVLVRRKRRVAGAMLLAGALPMLAFSAVQPNPGHVFMGALPALVVLCVIAATRSLGSDLIRISSSLLATGFLFGWFGTFSSDIWLHPRALVSARDALTRRLQPQTDFVTDLGRTADYSRALLARDPSIRCMGFSPALTATHALADINGPTSATIRWNAEQRLELAEAIRAARCPWFVYQVGGFDRPDRPSWFIGEDLIAIGESYRVHERLGPATYALERRATPQPARVETLPMTPERRRLALGVELVIPLGREVSDADLLRIDYTLSVSRLATLIGAAPHLEYRFEKSGTATTEYADLFDLSVNRPTHTLVAVNPAMAETRWIGEPGTPGSRHADGLRFRLRARGRFTPKTAELEVSGISVAAPGAPEGPAPAPSCELERDLLSDATTGVALPRNVALRASAERVSLHPNPTSEQGAEVYFPIKPCADSCLVALAGIELPPGNGDGAELDVNVLQGPSRPRLVKLDVLPGAGPSRLEIPLQRFASESVLLRFGSLPHGDPSQDFLWLQRPRLARCTARTSLSEALRQERATAEGAVEARGDDVAIGPGQSKLTYPFTVVADTCLELGLGLDGSNGAYGFLIGVRADGLVHGVTLGEVKAGETRRLDPVSMHDFHKREVVLELHFERKPDTAGTLRLIAPRLGRCPR